MTPSKEVNDAVGAAPTRTKELTATEQLQLKRDELRQAKEQLAQAEQSMDTDGVITAQRRIVVVKDFIAKLEAQAHGEVEAAARTAAEKRIVGISRAAGSVAASIQDDEAKVLEAARALADAADRLNARYAQYVGLVAEDSALRDRFGIGSAKLSSVIAPQVREQVVTAARTVQAVSYADYHTVRPSFEEDEHRLRTRRDYAEVAGSEAHRIITAAGLKPFPPLTEKQRRAVEAAQGEATVGGLEMLAQEAAAVLGLPPGVSAMHADVHRG